MLKEHGAAKRLTKGKLDKVEWLSADQKVVEQLKKIVKKTGKRVIIILIQKRRTPK